jgi:NAD(P)H-dependent FMN reductase
MSQTTTPKIGVIVCSQRTPRAGPQITDFVFKTIQKANSSAILSLIDLEKWSLPMFDEPGIPSEIKDPNNYIHDHTKRWSTEISSHSAFVFVTPQYNWGYPASIKNAIDYLFHEWKGKPAMIVSYGGHGGGKAAVQLQQVLTAVRMKPVESSVQLQFPSKEFLYKAVLGQDMELDCEGEASVWDDEKGNICKAFDELLLALDA